MRASVRPCLGHDIGIGYEMCQCKTMSRTWHQHKYVKASVRPCLGHHVSLDFDS
ncbi:hypothetical protein F383_20294 [Gossypium arboreum]|uniref:Uncharacterized protein n=1 Tax=Gossypium arboreum TaxID=29729 RepID=A0A0B0NN17_GOSAR|nr:hypothetical protein F383_20294 [Gossypium arboreum]